MQNEHSGFLRCDAVNADVSIGSSAFILEGQGVQNSFAEGHIPDDSCLQQHSKIALYQLLLLYLVKLKWIIKARRERCTVDLSG